MSRINIQGTIDNITSQTNVYTPIIEAIVNSIDSISEKGIENGKIEISLIRNSELDFDGSLPSIKEINIRDNGIGFNKKTEILLILFIVKTKKRLVAKDLGDLCLLSILKMSKLKVCLKKVTHINRELSISVKNLKLSKMKKYLNLTQ